MHDNYTSPLSTRYASEKMRHIFSDDMKFSTWRRLWVALAEAEHELGLPVTQEQIDELRAHVDDIDYECAARYESQLRHDVMSHVHAYGDACPGARAIIHLGATSCYVGDNADIIIMREALLQIKSLLVNAIAAVTDFAEKYCDVPTLAYTHFQAAQPTTAGKRACLWAQDLLFDLERRLRRVGSDVFPKGGLQHPVRFVRHRAERVQICDGSSAARPFEGIRRAVHRQADRLFGDGL